MARTEAQNRATYKYAKAHLKRVPLDLQLSDYEELKQAAEAAGLSVNGFIKAAIKAAIAAGADPVQGTRGGVEAAGAAGLAPSAPEK